MDFQKLALVDPQQIGPDSRVNHIFQAPTKKSLSALDKEMREVLETDISDSDKVFQYNQILQRYRTYDEKSNQPVTVKIDPNTISQSLKPDYLSRKIPEQVLCLTPITFRAKAAEILDRIQESGHMSWDDKGQLVLDGKSVENSNMVDLVNDVVRNRKTTSPPVGWQAFATGLRSLNIPEEIIGNRDRIQYIRSNVPQLATSLSPASDAPRTPQDSGVFTTPPTALRAGRGSTYRRLARGRASPIINWTGFT